MGKFILVLYREIKKYGIFGVKLFSGDVSIVGAIVLKDVSGNEFSFIDGN